MGSLQLMNEEHQSVCGIEADYRGSDFHFQAKWQNPGHYGISYLQTITRRLWLGGDIFYNHKQGLSVPTLGGKWAITDKDYLAAVCTFGHLTLSYFYQPSPYFGFGTELTFQKSQTGWDSAWSCGASFNHQTASFKTGINNMWKVNATYDQQISPTTRFTLATELDHLKKQYRFGIGLALAG